MIARFSSRDQERVLATTTCGGFVLAPDIVPIQCQPESRIHVYTNSESSSAVGTV